MSLGTGTIEGISLPADPEDVKAAMEAEWGEPDRYEVDAPGCTVMDPDAKMVILDYGDVSATGWYVEGHEEPAIDAWDISGPDVPGDTSTPFGFTAGDDWVEAFETIPAADVEFDDLRQAYVMTTEAKDGMSWISDYEAYDVVSAGFNQRMCD